MASLLVQTSFIGDAILTTPLVAALAARGPVDMVVTPAGAAVLSNNPLVRHLVVYDKRRKDRGPSGLVRIARAVRAADSAATAYLAQGSIRSAFLARLAGYKQRVGFDTSAGRLLYTRRIPFNRAQHHAERLMRLAIDPDGVVPRDMLRPQLYPSDADRAAVDELLGAAPNADRPLLALAPGSVWATKRWPYYAELAAALRSTHRSVIVGSRDDAPLASDIMRATGGDAIDASGRLTLLGSADLIGRCAVIVTNDSAPLHLASAMNTPTIAIFGPTVPAFGFGPLAESSAIAERTTLHCRPCHPHGPMVCPLGHWRCMRDLSLETVLARIKTVA